MNKYEKEVQKSLLKNERDVLDLLEKTYLQSQIDILTKISELLARNDTQNIRSIIYQLDYQKALKKQIDAIIEKINRLDYFIDMYYEELENDEQK